MASSIRSILAEEGTAGRMRPVSQPYTSRAVRTISREELRIRVVQPVPGKASKVAPASSSR